MNEETSPLRNSKTWQVCAGGNLVKKKLHVIHIHTTFSNDCAFSKECETWPDSVTGDYCEETIGH